MQPSKCFKSPAEKRGFFLFRDLKIFGKNGILIKTSAKRMESMKAFQMLPQNYTELFSLNLQKEKKTALLVNGLSLLLGLVMIIPMVFVVPFSTMVQAGGLSALSIRLLVLSVLYIVYMVLHELVHGMAMKLCGTKKVKYGFTGMYAFAGSDDYYDKKGYIFIALAPVVVWGIVLAVVNCLVPKDWFWVVYLIQTFNVSGAAGDWFVTVKFSGLPKDILVKDYGVGMTVYSANK